MLKTFRQTIIASTAIIGLSAVAALAAPPGTGDPTATRAAPMSSAQAPAKASMRVTIEQRITDLHAKLQISPAQQPQWDQFAQVMRDNAKSMDQEFQTRAQAITTMNAAENMKSYALISAQHAQDMQKLVPAFGALYGTMSDSQKHMADQVFRDNADHARHG
jgi:hypothetical protein